MRTLQTLVFKGSFDLIVQQEESGKIIKFEFCYGKGEDEYANKSGHTHLKVDDGVGCAGHFKMISILLPDGCFDWKATTDRFLHANLKIDTNVASFIHRKLLVYLKIQKNNQKSINSLPNRQA